MGSYVGPVARAHCYLKHLGTAFLSIAETVVTFLIVNYCFATLLLHSVDCFKLIFFPFDLRPPGHHIYNYFLPIYKTSYTLPFRINVYTRLFIQRLFSTIHVLIRAYTFINSRVSKVKFPRSSEFKKVRLQLYIQKICFLISFIYFFSRL